MKINGLKLHRKVSWLVAFFSLVVLIIVSSHKFLEIYISTQFFTWGLNGL